MTTLEDEIEELTWQLRRVVSIANGKGGVFKTTTATNTAAAFAGAGFRVLLVDLDRQGNTLLDLFGRRSVYAPGGKVLLGDEGRHLSAAVQGLVQLAPVISDVRPGLDLITGGIYLDDLSGVLQSRIVRSGRESIGLLLARALAPLAEDYDMIFLDTPPGDPLLQRLALGASRWMYVPTKSDPGSIYGLKNLADLLPDVRQVNPYLEVAGVLLVGTSVASTKVRSEARKEIEEVLGGVAPVFKAMIRPSEPLARAFRVEGKLAHELPRSYDLAGAVADEYAAAAEELKKRITTAEAEEDAEAGDDESQVSSI